ALAKHGGVGLADHGGGCDVAVVRQRHQQRAAAAICEAGGNGVTAYSVGWVERSRNPVSGSPWRACFGVSARTIPGSSPRLVRRQRRGNEQHKQRGAGIHNELYSQS